MTDRDFTLGVQRGSVTTPQLRPGGGKAPADRTQTTKHGWAPRKWYLRKLKAELYKCLRYNMLCSYYYVDTRTHLNISVPFLADGLWKTSAWASRPQALRPQPAHSQSPAGQGCSQIALVSPAAAAESSVVSDSVRPHGRQPTRLPVPGFSRREPWSGLPWPSPLVSPVGS